MEKNNFHHDPLRFSGKSIQILKAYKKYFKLQVILAGSLKQGNHNILKRGKNRKNRGFSAFSGLFGKYFIIHNIKGNTRTTNNQNRISRFSGK